ncbi:MAG TPA: hypothetical protein VGQ54_18820 [Burkholderiales bacterium]|jgi:hypothetical protein|nr:hypothetical protein [Burkholderiales bacterium]
MTTESILLSILILLAVGLVIMGIATIILINTMRAVRSEQQATRRVVANMDWTTIFASTQAHAKESVRILDILDKRLQKLEALEKIQLTQSNINLRGKGK